MASQYPTCCLLLQWQCNTLILVHRQPLLDQWVAQLALFLQMQLGPVRFTVDARSQAAHHPFNHNLIIRETELCIDDDDLRIQEI